MRIYDIITKKKQGYALTQEEIDFTIKGYMTEEIKDYQMSALAMAICLKGMDEGETFCLTKSMMESGDLVDLSPLGTLSVDKHSTGGVGDKTTLIVAPIVASIGSKVAKMSGRGLGFTGGTVDKLESLDGYKVSLDTEDFLKQVQDIGICVIGQSKNLAPADKKLYALRDVTATIDSIPLIASSIMSKKLASGSHSIVLDVKCGSGAFMKTKEESSSLAKAMISIGKSFNKNICALVTNMDVPLGRYIGNRLEVYEATEVLCGRGEENLREICIALATNMVALSQGIDKKKARSLVLESISCGKALEKMKEWIKYQGGDVSYIENPQRLLMAKYKKDYLAKEDGYISKINAQGIGSSSMLLGAGRVTLDSKIDFDSGIVLHKTYGDFVKKGDIVATMYSSENKAFENCERELDTSISYSDIKPQKQVLIYEEIF